MTKTTTTPPVMHSSELYEILRMKDLTALLKRSRAMIYLDLDPQSRYYNPRFPKPLRLSAGTIGWKAADVYAYIDALAGKGDE